MIALSSNVVQFRDRSVGFPTTWAWDFGDGNTSTERNPEHTYAQLDVAQEFEVVLETTDAFGLQSRVTKTVQIPASSAILAPYAPDLGNTLALDQGDGYSYIAIDEYVPD